MRLIDADALSNRILLTTYTKQGLYTLNLLSRFVQEAPTICCWISVDDRMPQMCEPVLLTGKNKFGNSFPAQIGYYDGLEWQVFGQPLALEKIGASVTHWMPRPEPPEADK